MFFLLGYCFQRSSDSIPFSYSQRLLLKNTSAEPVKQTQWKIKVPVGTISILIDNVLIDVNGESSWVNLPDMIMPPYATEHLSVTFNGAIDQQLIENKLLASRPTVSNVESLKMHAESFTSIESILDDVHLRLEYSGFQSRPLTIQETLRKASGDCTEFTLLTYYYLSYLGYKVIPVEGYYSPRSEGKLVGGGNAHAWLLVEIDREWMVVDPLYKNVQKITSEYSVVNVLEEGNSSPRIINSTLPVSLI